MINRFILFLLFPILLTSCSDHPEEKILGKWVEVKSEYEDYEVKKLQDHGHREIRRHETEVWVFRPDHSFEITNKEGAVAQGDWTLLGRGHILKLKYSDGEPEVYDITNLDEEALELNIDIGMEIKGVARLFFQKSNVIND
ncbi:hypothetical protein RCC89_15940 [Cytophagaceae bacterium ABcell3]|nr:hypothetical protein RCC89_15940 [Cytophagaceae bacterium ABcell3]